MSKHLIGVSPPPDIDYCLIETVTNIGLSIKMKYHVEENGYVQIDAVSEAFESTPR